MGAKLKAGMRVVALLLLLAGAQVQDASAAYNQGTRPSDVVGSQQVDNVNVDPRKQATPNNGDGEHIETKVAGDTYDSYEGYEHPKTYANGCPRQWHEPAHFEGKHRERDNYDYAKPIGQANCPPMFSKNHGSRPTYEPYGASTQSRCPFGLEECKDVCTNLECDDYNCGDCGVVCQPKASCIAGICRCDGTDIGKPCAQDCGCCNANCVDGLCCAPGEKAISEICADPSQCCSKNCADGACCAPGKKAISDRLPCADPSQCCSNHCVNVAIFCDSTCSTENGVPVGVYDRLICCRPGSKGYAEACRANGDCCTNNCTVGGTCEYSCFSAESKVNIKESSVPVSMRELKTGQHVECLDSGDDMLAPSTLKWCEVINFIHAADAKVRQQRISFNRPNGSPGSTTLAQTHLVYKLTSPSAKSSVGVQASDMKKFGAFELVPAIKVRSGDIVVITLKEGARATKFVSVPVNGVETVPAEGLYLPVIEQPYIVVDGVVMPLWTSIKPSIVTSKSSDSAAAQNALLHYAFSPLYMQHLQPVGTSGKQAQWDGQPLWPGVRRMTDLIDSNPGVAVDFDAVQRLFKPKYAAWKAARASDDTVSKGAAPIITLEQVLDVMGSVLVPGSA